MAAPAPQRRSRVTHPRDLLPLFRQHFGVGVLVTSVIGFVAVWMFLLLPRKYDSEAEILVRVGRESVRPDATATMGPTIDVTQTRLSELNSNSTILQSEDLLRTVAGDLYAKPEAQRAALDRLERDLKIYVEEESNIISVRFRSNDPRDAQSTLAKILERYLEKHVSSYRTPGSEMFFMRRTEEVSTRIAKARATLQSRLNELGAHSLDDHRQSLLTRLDALTRTLAETNSSLAVSRARLQQIDEGIRGMKAMQVLEETDTPSATRAEIERYLTSLRLQEQKLLANYDEDTSVVQDLRQQIKLAEDTLRAQGKDRVVVRRGINSNRQRLEFDRLTERTSIAGFEAKQKSLEVERKGLREQLVALREHEGEFVALKTQLAVLETERQRYLTGLEQARADTAMAADKITNISVVQAPTLPRAPAGPPRSWILIFGAVLALGGGLGTVLLVDFFDSSFQVARDVRDHLELEVLATLPSDDALESPMSRAMRPDNLELPAAAQRELGFLVGHVLGAQATNPMVLAVTSPDEGAGTSTMAFHLAQRLAASNVGDVVLVDANDSERGLTQALECDAANSLYDIGITGLQFLPRWRANCDVVSLFESIRQHARGFRFIVLDLPSVTTSGAAVETAREVDQSVLVVTPETDPKNAKRCLQILESRNVNVLGTALNQQELRLGSES